MLGQNIGRVGLPDMSAGGRPSLTLDFVGIPVLNERVTFSRTSGATWFSADGVLEGVDFSVTSNTISTGSKTFTLDATAGVNRYWAAGDTVLISQQSNSANNMTGTVTSYTASTQVLVVNVTSTGGSGTIASWRIGSTMPRFDYNPATLAARGLLIEEQRTNSILQSQDFTTTWLASGTGPAVVTANTTTSLDGAVNADTVSGTATGSDRVQQTVTVAASTTYVISFFVKNSTSLQSRFHVSNPNSGTTNSDTYITWSGSAITGFINQGTTVGVAVALPNNWWRVYFVFTTNASDAGTATVRFYPNTTPGDATYKAVFLWGAQLEAGAFPTSYIPTTTIALTRSADVASVNTLSPWYNATEGTLYGEVSSAAPTVGGASRRIANINDGTEADRITVAWAGLTAVGAAFVSDNGVTQAGFNSPSGAYPFPTKVALAYKAADFQAAVNGSAFSTVSTGTVPTVNRMTIGDVVTGGTGPQNLNGHIRRITYYPRRLSQAELISITT